MLVPCKARYKRKALSKIYNAFSVPHLLALSPFWNFFRTSDKGACRSNYFRCAKFLVCVLLWASVRVVLVYGVVNPFAVVAEHRLRF